MICEADKMITLTTNTSELKERLTDLTDYKDREDVIIKHIVDAEKLNYKFDNFPSGLDWFNTSKPLTNAHLEGKIVVLDFFTYCCINCLHIIPHLRQLEENFSVADGLVVIGVHSAKFDNEKDSDNILQALKRYNISHPVVNDVDCFLWNKLNISCWPTIVILGPQSQLLFVLVGEGHKEELLLFVKVALKFYKNSINSRQLPIVPCNQVVSSSLLSFPGKISRWDNLFAVSDSGNHRIIVFDGDNNVIKFTVGGKNSGFKDGTFDSAQFNCPQGVTFYDETQIYVADTGNHAIRLINLKNGQVSTVVGNGQQGVDYKGGKVGIMQEISSPWDVCIVPSTDVEVPVTERFPSGGLTPPVSFSSGQPPPPPPPPMSLFSSGDIPPPPPLFLSSPLQKSKRNEVPSKVLLIAAAGTHQIWGYFIDKGCTWWEGRKFEKNVCVAVAGSGKEENRNNRRPLMAGFAQPSGLTYSKELKTVFVADSESSSVRKISTKDGCVSHVAGGARSPNDLFRYGDADGKGYDVKLQHPLNVLWSSKKNSVFVCDTYNHKVKVIDVDSGECRSLHSCNWFDEPSGACLNKSEDLIYVCDTNNNCVKTINLLNGKVDKLQIREQSQTVVETPSNEIWEAETILSKSGGVLNLKIKFSPENVHGKWKLQPKESAGFHRESGLDGKMTTNVVELTFDAGPSTLDYDILEIFFNLIICGSETCDFKKVLLKLRVKRVEEGKNSVVCQLEKNLV